MNTQVTVSAQAVGSALFKGAIELLIFGTLPFLIGVYALPGGYLWPWLGTLPLMYAAGCAYQLILKPARTITLHPGLVLIAGLQAYLLFGGELRWYWMILIGWLLAYRGSRMAWVPWHKDFPGGLGVIGLLLYFTVSVVMRFVPSLALYSPELSLLGSAALAAALLIVNQSHLKQETYSASQNPSVPQAVLWHNRALMLLLLGIVMAVALFRQLQEAAAWLKNLLLAQIAAWLSRPSPQPEPLPQPSVPKGPPPGLEPAGPPSALWVWLEKAFMAVTVILLAAAALYTAYLLLKRLPGWLRKLCAWLASWLRFEHLQDGGGGYKDETESLMDWSALRLGLKDRLRGLFLPRTAEPGWNDLADNAERVRYLYSDWLRRAIRAGYRFQPQLTPRETAGDVRSRTPSRAPEETERLVSAYESVRYGGQAVSDAEVERLKTKQGFD
ncbi:DUF4129 domain-containing protein [Paenibacillus filicis]|uniref:DUF4129 domain-containing protein n=1 Tax=Paenibacillus gyeongsangnamensis TaxID=3388067 RepID=A0ABT4Q9E0_9BACL|nr:DUF4129 domain-containing protein [Paenibacillus filicis]MCZ8513491.1 DUF4129 domain-containing protein [Paenibacillus filicis]